MVASKGSALKRNAHPRLGHSRGTSPTAEESGGIDSLAATFKMDSQQRFSLMELMTRIRAAGIEPDDPRVCEMVADSRSSSSPPSARPAAG